MIDVAFTRADLRPADVAVVIDVLRATTTATQALAAGYRSVLCVESVEVALTLRGPGRVLAGERHCVRPPGFDQGNSPREAAHRRGDELVLATTNGAPAVIAAAQTAPVVLLACLLNLDAVVAALQGADVQIVCAGTDGAVALEDVYAAGRISARLRGQRTDAARVAEGVARSYPTALAALRRAPAPRRSVPRTWPATSTTAPRSPPSTSSGACRRRLTAALRSSDAASRPSRRSRRLRGGQDDAHAGARAHPRRGAGHARRGRRLPPLRPRAAGGARDHAAPSRLQSPRHPRPAPGAPPRPGADPQAGLPAPRRHVPAAPLRARRAVHDRRGPARLPHRGAPRRLRRPGLPRAAGGPAPPLEGPARLLPARLHHRRGARGARSARGGRRASTSGRSSATPTSSSRSCRATAAIRTTSTRR